MITWRPEFQNVQGLPWQEYDVMSLGMQAALIRPNCVLFLILPFDIVISRFHLSFFVVEAYAWPQDFLRKHHSVRKKTGYHDVSVGWEIHGWMRLQTV